MSRSGYSDQADGWVLICWRGAVTSAIRGKRGQAFLREMLTALDSMPRQRLIRNELEYDGDVCAIGSVGKARGIDQKHLDPDDHDRLAAVFGISKALVKEIEYVNDEEWLPETPEQRFVRMRKWVVEQLAVGA